MISRCNSVLLSYFLSIFFITILFIGCGEKKPEAVKDKKDTSSASKDSGSVPDSPGKKLFYAASEENNVACADCHSDGTNADRPLTKYFSDVIGANYRESAYHGIFKGEEVTKNAGGATICWEAYLKYKEPLSSEQISQLNEFYASLTKEKTSQVKNYETIALPKRDKSKLKDVQKEVMSLTGDPANGERIFNTACSFCHGDNSNVKKVPHILEDFEGNTKSVTYMIRLGDGAMPFFHQGVLSNQEIADIAAYLMTKK